jgi:DNA-binding transcriptional ArsR family regulator
MSGETAEKPIAHIDDPRYVRALAHPLRVRILALLREREASPVQLADHVGATLGTVAYHVRTLEKLGLVELVATRQRRGATEHVFAVRQHPVVTDSAWARCSPITKQVMVSSLLTDVRDDVERAAAAGGFDRSDAHFTRTPLKLDEEGWTALAQATKDWLRDVGRIEAETKTRIKQTKEEPFDAGLVILFFQATSAFDAPPAAIPTRRTPRRRTSKAGATKSASSARATP